MLGGDDVPAEHPYFKVGRPGGCTFCEDVEVTYSTHTPQAEIDRLTSFDFSCLTRLIYCKIPEDIMPAVGEEGLYGKEDPNSYAALTPLSSTEYCRSLLWAVARDSGTAFVVDVLSISQEKGNNGPYAIARIKIVEYLKGDALWPVGSVFDAPAEEMIPGNRYVVLPQENTYGKRDRYKDELEIVPVRCGVQEDTPEIRHELEKGFAQNDNLRGPELR